MSKGNYTARGLPKIDLMKMASSKTLEHYFGKKQHALFAPVGNKVALVKFIRERSSVPDSTLGKKGNNQVSNLRMDWERWAPKWQPRPSWMGTDSSKPESTNINCVLDPLCDLSQTKNGRKNIPIPIPPDQTPRTSNTNIS